jgi:hypothetical protein
MTSDCFTYPKQSNEPFRSDPFPKRRSRQKLLLPSTMKDTPWRGNRMAIGAGLARVARPRKPQGETRLGQSGSRARLSTAMDGTCLRGKGGSDCPAMPILEQNVVAWGVMPVPRSILAAQRPSTSANALRVPKRCPPSEAIVTSFI